MRRRQFFVDVDEWPATPSFTVGAELHNDLVNDCRARLVGQLGLSFVLNDELDAPEHQGLYDAVICMEVLVISFTASVADATLGQPGLVFVSEKA